MTYRTLRAALAATLVFFSAACGDDPTGPDNTIDAQMRGDVAVAAGEAMAQDVEAMSSDNGESTLFAFGGDFDSGDCTTTLGVIVCTSTFGNVDGQAELTFRGENGSAQTAFDAATTSSVLIETDASGEVSRAGWDAEFSSSRDFTVSGLLGTETSRTWNGTGSLTFTSSMHAAAREYRLETETTVQNVVVPASGSPRYPSSGTVTTVVNIRVTQGEDQGEDFTTTATATFNGTAQVPLVVGGANYTLNLQTRAVTAN